MWRSEENIIAQTRPARLDTRYSTAAATATACTPVSAGWFHIPGSGASAPPMVVRPDGLVSSACESTSYTSACHSGSAVAARPAREPRRGDYGAYSSHRLLRDPERVDGAGGVSSSVSDVSSLLRQYRDENARLRAHIKAKEVREAHLLAKLEETGRSCAHAQLAWQEQRRAAEEASCGLFRSVDDGGVSLAGGGTAVERLRSQLADRDAEVRELQGRVEAYREALRRSRAYTAATTATPPAHAVERHGGSEGTAPATASLHLLLLESLHTADYLVKVFNAMDHCHSTRHGDGSDRGCRRSLHDCRLHCLQAALRGAPLSPELLELEAGRENDTAAANVETAVAVREELLYCQTMAVRLAASLLGAEAPTPDPGDHPRVSTACEQDTAATSPPPARPTTASSPPPAAAAHADGHERSDDETDVDAAEGESVVERVESAVTAPAPAAAAATATGPSRRRPSRCRPDVGDCEVQ